MRIIIIAAILYGWYRVGYIVAKHEIVTYRSDEPDPMDIFLGMLMSIMVSILLGGILIGLWFGVGALL